MTSSLPLEDLVISLDHIVREEKRPASQVFARKLLTQLGVYQKQDDS